MTTCSQLRRAFTILVATAAIAATSAPPATAADAPASPGPLPSATPQAAPSTLESATPSPIPTATRPPAGVVPTQIAVDFGGDVSNAFALAHIDAQIAREAELVPGATIDIRGLTLPSGLRAGDRLDALASVKISAGDAFADTVGTTSVHVEDDAYPKLDPQILLYSDDPERLVAAADGVLYRATVEAGRSARVYAYHVSETPGRKLYLVLRSIGSAERVQMLGYTAGPENAFAYVGHRSTAQYLLERGAGESSIVDLAPGTPALFDLGGRAMRAGDLIASIYDLRTLGGGPLEVSVVAVTGTRDPLELLGGAELAGDGHGRRGEFSLADVPPLAVNFTVGAAEAAPFSIGAPTLANLRPGGRPLGGDYGVLREISLQLTNPTASDATAYFYEAAAGGNATTSLWFTGDPAPTEIACVRIPANRYSIKAFTLAAGETRSVTGEYMTDGTSYFPLLFGLTATPPSPPPGPYSADACTPKSPPPSAVPTAAPATTESPVPSASP